MGQTTLDRAITLGVLVFVVGVLLILVLTGHGDSATLTFFSGPAVMGVIGLVLGNRQASIEGKVNKVVHQTNGLISGPLADIKATGEANAAKLDALPGAPLGESWAGP